MHTQFSISSTPLNKEMINIEYWVIGHGSSKVKHQSKFEALLPKHQRIKGAFICDQADVTTFSFFPCNNIPLIKLTDTSVLLFPDYCWPQTLHRNKDTKLNLCESKEWIYKNSEKYSWYLSWEQETTTKQDTVNGVQLHHIKSVDVIVGGRSSVSTRKEKAELV